MGDIDWASTAAAVGSACSAANPEWLDNPLATNLSGEAAATLADLPLLTTTVAALSEINLDRDAPLETLADNSRRSLVESKTKNGWLALLDLSVALECWWPTRSSSPIWRVRSEGRTLEAIAEAIVREYISADGHRLDEGWVGLVLRRNSWGMPKATLDEIGQVVGVTRERVRQVLRRLETMVGVRQWPLPPILAEAIEVVRDSEFRNVQQALVASGFVTDDDWTPEELVDLLNWFGYRGMAEGLDSQFIAAQKEMADPRLTSAVRNSRSAMGFLRLDSIALDSGEALAPGLAGDAVRQVYSRVYESGGWLLAGDAKATMVENAAARQLSVSDPLEPAELLEGLARVQRQRTAPRLPQADIVLDLLKQAGALVETGSGVTGPKAEPEEGSLNAWLVSMLTSAVGNVLHKEVLSRAAIEDRINLSSLGVYYLYSPVVRPCGDRIGLIRLVGHTPDREEMDRAIRLAEVTRVPGGLDWSASQKGFDLEVVMGSNFLGTGVLPTPVALSRLWPDGGARIACQCSRTFKGRVSVAGGNVTVGWAPLVHHLLLEHGVVEGMTISLALVEGGLRLISWS